MQRWASAQHPSPPENDMARIVGLTGGIGSGKSAVGDLFAAHGVPVIDTDAIAHELTAAGGEAIADIRATFGSAVITPEGALDRREMRARAFADPVLRKRLEAILHPRIRSESQRRIVASGDACYLLLMVPLLIETGAYRDQMSRIAVVDCPETTQIERVMSRSGLQRAEVERIMAAQATRAQRLAVADDVIDNGGSLTELARSIQLLHQTYTSLFCTNG